MFQADRLIGAHFVFSLARKSQFGEVFGRLFGFSRLAVEPVVFVGTGFEQLSSPG